MLSAKNIATTLKLETHGIYNKNAYKTDNETRKCYTLSASLLSKELIFFKYFLCAILETSIVLNNLLIWDWVANYYPEIPVSPINTWGIEFHLKESFLTVT